LALLNRESLAGFHSLGDRGGASPARSSAAAILTRLYRKNPGNMREDLFIRAEVERRADELCMMAEE
jgi:hypothetical protein